MEVRLGSLINLLEAQMIKSYDFPRWPFSLSRTPPLERVCKEMGYPSAIRVDQGSEFVSRDLDLWAHQNHVTLDFSRPGKPTDNAFIEAFNRRLRAECLNTHWFVSLADAREKLEDWRRDYNEVRPHGAIGNKPPAALLNCIGATSPSMPKETGKSTLR
jgi:putative transposase